MLRGHIREIDVGENSGCDRYRMHRSMRETKDQSLPTHDNRRRMHNDEKKEVMVKKKLLSVRTTGEKQKTNKTPGKHPDRNSKVLRYPAPTGIVLV